MFLQNYLTYASANEAPELFHVWAGYTALSATVARRIWLPFGKRAIYPNLYVMLVGEAGNGKSIAMYFCKRLLTDVSDNKNPATTISISGEIETPAGLWRYVAGQPNLDPPKPSPVAFPAKWPDGQTREVHPMTIIANEFIDFISMADKEWLNALNNISDQDVYHYRTKNQGEDRIVGPYITLLGGLPTDIAHDLQKTRIIASGFARRTIFQFGERNWKNPHPRLTETPEQVEAYAYCLSYLKKLQRVAGGFTWTADAEAWWDAWYCEQNVQVPLRPVNVRSWFATKPDRVLQVAMLTALAESFDLVLHPHHFQIAIDFFDRLEAELYKIFGGVGRNEMAAVAAKIREFVSNLTEPIGYKSLYLKMWNFCSAKDPQKEFRECMNYLVDTKALATRTLQVGQIVDNIYATPTVMAEFERLASKQPPPPGATPSA